MAKRIVWDVTTDAKSLTAMIADLAKRGASINQHFKIAAASCVVHMLQHGNATPMTRLVEVSDYRATALVKWALSLGMFKAGKDKDTNRDVFKKNDDTFNRELEKYLADKPAYIKALLDNSFMEFSPPKKAFEGLNIPALYYSMLSKIEEVLEDPDKSKHPDNVLIGLEEFRALKAKLPKPDRKKKNKPKHGPVVNVTEAFKAEVAAKKEIAA